MFLLTALTARYFLVHVLVIAFVLAVVLCAGVSLGVGILVFLMCFVLSLALCLLNALYAARRVSPVIRAPSTNRRCRFSYSARLQRFTFAQLGCAARDNSYKRLRAFDLFRAGTTTTLVGVPPFFAISAWNGPGET